MLDEEIFVTLFILYAWFLMRFAAQGEYKLHIQDTCCCVLFAHHQPEVKKQLFDKATKKTFIFRTL